MRPTPTLLCLLLATAACVTRSETRLFSDLDPRPVRVLGRWDVVLDDEIVGELSWLRIEGPSGARDRYRVERSGGQKVGWIGPNGRAYRYEPFHDEPVLVAMDKMTEDLRVLLELESEPRVAGSGALEASFRR